MTSGGESDRLLGTAFAISFIVNAKHASDIAGTNWLLWARRLHYLGTSRQVGKTKNQKDKEHHHESQDEHQSGQRTVGQLILKGLYNRFRTKANSKVADSFKTDPLPDRLTEKMKTPK